MAHGGGRRGCLCHRDGQAFAVDLRFAAVVAARPSVLASGGRCEGDVRTRHCGVEVGSTVALELTTADNLLSALGSLVSFRGPSSGLLLS